MRLIDDIEVGARFFVALDLQPTLDGKQVSTWTELFIEKKYEEEPFVAVCRRVEVRDGETYTFVPDTAILSPGEPRVSIEEVERYLAIRGAGKPVWPERAHMDKYLRVQSVLLGFDVSEPRHQSDLQLLQPRFRTWYKLLKVVGRRVSPEEARRIFDANLRAMRTTMHYEKFMHEAMRKLDPLGLVKKAYGPKPTSPSEKFEFDQFLKREKPCT